MKKIIVSCVCILAILGFYFWIQGNNESSKTGELDPISEQLSEDLRIEGTTLDIGSTSQEVIAELKEPGDKGAFEGSYYLMYDDITFFTDEKTSLVTAIAIRGNRKMGRVSVGMLPSEVKNILGKPISEGENQDQEIGGWSTTYRFGDRTLIFYSDKSDSVITTIFEKLEL